MTGAVLGALFGLFLVFLMGQALWGPLRFLLKTAVRIALGGLLLFVVDAFAAAWGWSLSINPVSAFVAGFLGIPGVVLLALLKHLCG
ncbi:MAG: pro-sigmaK processing inhibitor BofA family protein [Thermacetogeniaceae bacterium]